MIDPFWGILIGAIVTVIALVQAVVLAKINAVYRMADGINSRLRSDGDAKDGEINRLQAPDSGQTPQTRADGTGDAPVTVDRITKAVTVKPSPPKPE